MFTKKIIFLLLIVSNCFGFIQYLSDTTESDMMHVLGNMIIDDALKLPGTEIVDTAIYVAVRKEADSSLVWLHRDSLLPDTFVVGAVDSARASWISDSTKKIPVHSHSIAFVNGLTDTLMNHADSIEKYKDHANLNNLNSTNYTHLTAANHTDLTDAGASSLHYHTSDRDRANHTGTQAISTVTGLGDSLSNHRTLILSKSDTAHTHPQSKIVGLVDTVTAHRTLINGKLNITDTSVFMRDHDKADSSVISDSTKKFGSIAGHGVADSAAGAARLGGKGKTYYDTVGNGWTLDSLDKHADTLAKYKDHANLNNLNSTNYTHLTATNHTDLTDAGASTLHYHASDRDRANHTGTQAQSTINNLSDSLVKKADTNHSHNTVKINTIGNSNNLIFVNEDSLLDTTSIIYDPYGSGMTIFPSRIHVSPDEPTFRHIGVNTENSEYDTSSFSITGSNSATIDRAGFITLYGNDHDSGGDVEITAGYTGTIELISNPTVDFNFGNGRAFKVAQSTSLNGVDLGCYTGNDTLRIFSSSNSKGIHIFEDKVLLEDTTILSGVTRADSIYTRTSVASGELYSSGEPVSVQDQLNGKTDTTWKGDVGNTSPLIYRNEDFGPGSHFLDPSNTLTQGPWYNEFTGSSFMFKRNFGNNGKLIFYQDTTDVIMDPDRSVFSIHQGSGDLVVSHSDISKISSGTLNDDTVDVRIKKDSLIVNGYIKATGIVGASAHGVTTGYLPKASGASTWANSDTWEDGDTTKISSAKLKVAGAITSDSVYFRTAVLGGKLLMGSNYINNDGGTEGIAIADDGHTDILGTAGNYGDAKYLLNLVDNTDMAVGVGAGIMFQGKYTDAGGYNNFAGIKGIKANATSGNVAGQLHLQTRASGGSEVTRFMINENGYCGINTITPTVPLTVKGNFSDTGNVYVSGTITADSIFSRKVVIPGDTVVTAACSLYDGTTLRATGTLIYNKSGRVVTVQLPYTMTGTITSGNTIRIRHARLQFAVPYGNSVSCACEVVNNGTNQAGKLSQDTNAGYTIISPVVAWATGNGGLSGNTSMSYISAN